jgi:hypothetical protein
MTAEEIRTLMTEARVCALVMLENASYVERELAHVHISDDLRSRACDVCSSLVGTKHDILSELGELNEILASPAVDDLDVATRLERVVRWLSDDLPKMYELVAHLNAASEHDSQYTAASVLVTESAANILVAFNRVRSALDPSST